ncbi:hypothetical protein AURDEDRAFT_151299, partial [Auricularia subglabra TFB-10046 SS5]
MSTLVPPGKTLKLKLSNAYIRFKNKISQLSDDEKYAACEAQLRTVQRSLLDWRNHIIQHNERGQTRIFNEAAEQNNAYMEELKKSRVGTTSEVSKKLDTLLESIFKWRTALSDQSASLKVPGPKYDLSDIIEGSGPGNEILFIPPPAPPPDPVPSPTQSGASASSHVVDSREYMKVKDSDQWFPQMALPPPPGPPRAAYRAGLPVDADTSSTSGRSSMRGGMPGAQGPAAGTGLRPGDGQPAGGVGATDNESLRSVATTAFGGHSFVSFSSGGSGGSYRTSTDSSDSGSYYHSPPQSIDSHALHGAGDYALPPSGGTVLRSGLQGAASPQTAANLTHAMSSLRISAPQLGVPPPPP